MSLNLKDNPDNFCGGHFTVNCFTTLNLQWAWCCCFLKCVPLFFPSIPLHRGVKVIIGYGAGTELPKNRLSGRILAVSLNLDHFQLPWLTHTPAALCHRVSLSEADGEATSEPKSILMNLVEICRPEIFSLSAITALQTEVASCALGWRRSLC